MLLFFLFPFAKKLPTNKNSAKLFHAKKLLVKCWSNWHLEDMLILLAKVLVQVPVEDRVNASVGQPQNVADTVDEGVAVTAVAH